MNFKFNFKKNITVNFNEIRVDRQNQEFKISNELSNLINKVNVPMFVPTSQQELSTKLSLLEQLYNLEIIVVENKDKNLLYNVSSKYPLIFIHTPKTAGISITNALDLTISGHRTVKELELYLDKSIYNSYSKVAVVRNPYDRMVSLYKHALNADMEHARKDGYIGEDHSFETWFWNIVNHLNKIGHEPMSLMPCYDLMLNNSNKLDVDYILRFENLEEDWNIMFNDLSIEPPKLPKLNVTKGEHYSKYFQCQTGEIMIKFIHKFFKKDFDF